MKIRFTSIIFSVVIGTIQSCSTPAHVEKEPGSNLSNYKTYMWVNTMSNEKDAPARSTAFADLSIHNAVNEELQRWGWQETDETPDILISYDILVEKNLETQSDPVYTQPYSRIYYNRFTKKYSNIYYPSQFLGYQQSYQVPISEATVTITMMDADNDKKIWQGWTTERLGSARITDLNVRKSVRNIFKESGRVTMANK